MSSPPYNASLSEMLQSTRESIAGFRKAIDDVVVSMIPQGFSVLAGIVTSILMARGLGPDGMGQYALILSVSGIAMQLSDLGIGQTAIRYAARAASQGNYEQQFRVLRWAFRLRLLLITITSAAAFGLVEIVAHWLWHATQLTPLVRWSLLGGMFAAVSHVPMVYFQSLRRFRMNTMVSVGQTCCTLLGLVTLELLRCWTLWAVIGVGIITSGIGALVFMLLVPRGIFWSRDDFDGMGRGLWRRLLLLPVGQGSNGGGLDQAEPHHFAFFMMLSSVVVALTLQADIWLMGIYVSKPQIGIYQVATRFTLPLVMVMSALNTALWPRVSACAAPADSLRLLRGTFRVTILAALTGAVYALSAPLFMGSLFGPDYAGGRFLAQLLCLRYCVAILTCPIGVIGYNFGLVRLYWLVNILQMLVVVVTNVLLLPRLGPLGSAIALLGNDMIGCAIVAAMIIRKSALLTKVRTTGTGNEPLRNVGL